MSAGGTVHDPPHLAGNIEALEVLIDPSRTPQRCGGATRAPAFNRLLPTLFTAFKRARSKLN